MKLLCNLFCYNGLFFVEWDGIKISKCLAYEKHEILMWFAFTLNCFFVEWDRIKLSKCLAYEKHEIFMGFSFIVDCFSLMRWNKNKITVDCFLLSEME
jgi:hypothetical protein